MTSRTSKKAATNNEVALAEAQAKADYAAENNGEELFSEDETSKPYVTSANTTRGGRKLGKVTPELEDAFEGTVAVVKADGTATTLGSFDPDDDAAVQGDVEHAPKPTRKAAAAPVANGRAGKTALAAAEKARIKAELQAEKAKQAAKDEKAKRIAADKQAKADVRAAAQKVKDDQKAKAKAEREAKAEARKAEREAAKAEKARLKTLAQGETGDPVKDALFHEAVDQANKLAIVPFNTSTLNLGYLGIPGVTLDAQGLDLPEDMTLGAWVETATAIKGVSDVGQWAFGDVLRFGAEKFPGQYEVIAAELGIEYQRAKDGTTSSTVKNAKYVAGLYPRDTRVAGASFTHHLEAAGLFATNPAAALNILQEAAAGRKPASWVRQQVAAIKGPGVPASVRKAEKEDALLLVAKEQHNFDLEAEGDEAIVSQVTRDEVNALIGKAQRDDMVDSGLVIRSLARLEAQLRIALNERDELQVKLDTAMKLLGERDGATQRLISADVETVAADTQPEDSDLSFLADTEDTDDAEGEDDTDDIED